MLSDIKGKEQSTVLERESFTTNFVNNSEVQLINKRATNESPYESPLVKRIFTLKQRKTHESPLFYYKNYNLIFFIYFVVTRGDWLSNAQFPLKHYGNLCGDSW